MAAVLALTCSPRGWGAAPIILGTNAPGVPLGTNELNVIVNASSNSLAEFQGHISPANFQLMGFASLGEVYSATNGGPLMVFTVPYSRLTNYQSAYSLNTLLEPSPGTSLNPAVIVPILVSNNVRSANLLRLSSGPAGMDWATGDWGHSGLIQSLVAASKVIPTGEILPDSVPFAVRIPIPRVWLLGYYSTQTDLVLRATGEIRLGSTNILHNEIISQNTMGKWAADAQRYIPGLPN